MKRVFLLTLLTLTACAPYYPSAVTSPALINNRYAALTEQLWIDWTPLASFPSTTDYNKNLAAARHAIESWSGPFGADFIRDPDSLLTPQLRAALLERLAQHAAVRAMRSPKAYLNLAENEPPSVWLDIDESCFHGSYEKLFNEPPPTGSSRPHFERTWEYAINKRGGRFTAIGTGEWSADIAVQHTTDGQHWADWMDEHDWAYEAVFWRGQYSLSCFAEFRAPQRTIHDVIEGHGSAIAVECLVRVQTANGVHALWNSQWHYDPDAQTWVVDSMAPYYVTQTPIFN